MLMKMMTEIEDLQNVLAYVQEPIAVAVGDIVTVAPFEGVKGAFENHIVIRLDCTVGSQEPRRVCLAHYNGEGEITQWVDVSHLRKIEDERRTIQFKGALPVIDGPWNTFRLGTKWADLRIGEIVKLEVVEPLPGQTVESATAEVAGVFKGPFGTMMREHAERNMCAVSSASVTAADLLEELESIYGEENTAAETIYTVVYLRRLPEPKPFVHWSSCQPSLSIKGVGEVVEAFRATLHDATRPAA
jgi:hypothetical protein